MRKIWITGASSGIGRQLAYDLAKQGDIPVMLARNEQKLSQIVQEIKEAGGQAHAYSIDLLKTSQLDSAIHELHERIGQIDVLINNAGFAVFEYADKIAFRDVQDMFTVNVLALMKLTQTVVPIMLEQKKGHIINVASQAGKLATPKSSAYTATKHAVLGYTNSLRLELENTSLKVSAVNPGPIRTPFF